MDDDEVTRSHSSDSTKEAVAETTLRDVDQQVRTFHQATASLAAFDQAYWSINRALSWITYRNPFHMDTSYLDGIMYPTMLGIPLVVEPAASSKLLQAIRRAEKPIVCFKGGKELHGSEWEPVNFPSDPKRWPQGIFDRSDVLREWPGLQVSSEADSDLAPLPHVLSGSLNLLKPSETQKRRTATEALPPGLDFEIGRKNRERTSPFSEALAKELGEMPTRAECLIEWNFYKPNGKRGRPKKAK